MITVFVGDLFLVGRASKKLIDDRLRSAPRDFNLDSFEGREAEASIILGAARSLPLLSERRVVVVHRAEDLRKGELETLASALTDIPETTDLILTASKIDRRLKLWQKIAEIGKIQEYRPLTAGEVAPWVTQEARLLGKRLSSEAIGLIAQTVGTEPGLLAAALEKISLYVGARPDVAAQDVAACVSGLSWKSVFELTEAVGRRDFPKALRLFNLMLEEGESMVALVALLARHFRILLRIKETGQDRSIPPYFLKDYLLQAERYQFQELSAAIDQIFRADWDLKRSPVSGSLVMEGLLRKLTVQAVRL